MGKRPYLFFAREISKRESGMLKLLLRKRIQHIGLILGGIKGFFQQPPSALFIEIYPRVMSRNYKIAAQLLRAAVQSVKFEKTVAVNAGIGRQAAFVTGGEFLHHRCPECVLEVEHVVFHAQPCTDPARVLRVGSSAAGFFGICTATAMQLHGNAYAVKSRFKHKRRRDGTVHAAAHGYQCLPLIHCRASAFRQCSA